MFSMTKSRDLDEGQSRYVDVNKRYYGEDVKFYLNFLSWTYGADRLDGGFEWLTSSL